MSRSPACTSHSRRQGDRQAAVIPGRERRNGEEHVHHGRQKEDAQEEAEGCTGRSEEKPGHAGGRRG